MTCSSKSENIIICIRGWVHSKLSKWRLLWTNTMNIWLTVKWSNFNCSVCSLTIQPIYSLIALLMSIFKAWIPSSPFNSLQFHSYILIRILGQYVYMFPSFFFPPVQSRCQHYDLIRLEQNYWGPQHLPQPLSQTPINSWKRPKQNKTKNHEEAMLGQAYKEAILLARPQWNHPWSQECVVRWLCSSLGCLLSWSLFAMSPGSPSLGLLTA